MANKTFPVAHKTNVVDRPKNFFKKLTNNKNNQKNKSQRNYPEETNKEIN